jgi:hypothetical protein
MYDHNKMLFPNAIATDDVSQAAATDGYAFLQELESMGRGFYFLHSMWPSLGYSDRVDLPAGYDYYVVSCHLEHIDFEWLRQQTVGPIIMLSDFNYYHSDYGLENVYFLRWMDWHRALDRMRSWFGSSFHKDIRYKASLFCNRITQSKLIAFTAVMEYLDRSQALTSLNPWLESKNVHDWQPTGNGRLDELTDIFRSKYLGQCWSMDGFTNKSNLQSHTANPAQVAYQEAALHFTNESFHYSQMHDRILPGPHLTEKTFKCLLGATAFIPVGQFDVYRTLETFGMRFDYGLDLSFDQDPGNLSRLEKIVDLIRHVATIDATDLYYASKHSCQHNQDLILSGDFARQCDAINQDSIQRIIKIVK